MSGISSVLNIAKEALLTHQASISVAGHNIANVDTPGYSRQTLGLSTVTSSPSGTGFFGNGVTGTSVTRQYDQFMVKRLTDQNSTINNLETMQQSLRVVESIFNEAPGLAVNDLMSQFWDAWQALTNNPEISSSRQTVIQQAELLNSHFSMMTSEINNIRNDISLNLSSSIVGLNSLTAEIATINNQITTSETSGHQQNDLRDTRDNLLKELSGLVDINFFETSSGAYNVMLSDGHTLVDQNQSWGLEWANNTLYWLSTNSNGATTSARLSSDALLGGSIGGLVEVNNQLTENNPDNYLGRLNSLANSLIREVNQQHTQGVGTTMFSDSLTGAETAKDAVLLQSSIDSQTATESIQEGTITINGREIGRIDGGVASYGLAKIKAYNAAQAINEAYAGVSAKLTTQVAGDAVAGVPATDGLAIGDSVGFTVNGIQISYGPVVGANELAAGTATAVVDAINTAITNYNDAPYPENIPKVTIRAIVGNGLNGGETNSIILQNYNDGDESNIVIGDIDSVADLKLGLSNGTYIADASHNTGQLSLFTGDGPIEISAGSNDVYLTQMGWASEITYSEQAVTPGAATSFVLNGTTINTALNDTAANIVTAIQAQKSLTGVTAELGNGTNGGVTGSIVFKSTSSDIIVTGAAAGSAVLGFSNFTKRSVAAGDTISGDGKLSYEFSDNGVANSLMGLDYADQLITDGGSFKIWLYNSNGTNALPQPVNIPMDRVYDLGDVVDAINNSIINAINNPAIVDTTNSWLTASIVNNQLVLTSDQSHQFAFGGDTSNFLATAGINTFFTGNSADSISINSVIKDDTNNLAAGTINQFGEIFNGDNSNALAITNIQRNEVIHFKGGTTDSLDGHYNSLVAEIGLKARSVRTDLEFNLQVNDQLNQMRDATSGVSLDEEMANLIKFQHAYSAAAKLITTSDEMMQALLNAI